MKTLTHKVRVRTLGITLAAACAASLPVHAQTRTSASKQENIGVVTGLAVGAAAGGPIGAVVGAAAGAWLGDRYHKQSLRSASLASHLDDSESERAALARNVADLHGSLTQSQDKLGQLDQALGRTDQLETEVSFRTNDASIDAKAVPPLLKLGALAAAMPEVKLHVEGYADPRGSDKLNDALSKRRAETVAGVLAQAGVKPGQMVVEGHGNTQSSSAVGDLDGYAFDRRVSVRIERQQGGTVASR